MTRAAQIYDFTLAPGGSQVLNVTGGYYRIQTASGPVRVTRDNGSRLGPLYAGQGEKQEFGRLILTDLTGLANTGLILVADDSFIDDRITGEVSVIDGGRALSLAGACFQHGGGLNPSVGNYNNYQIWNPANSGKRVYIEQVEVSSGTASLYYFGMTNVALTQFIANLTSSNKNASNPIASLTERRWDILASPMNPTLTMSPFVPANTTYTRKFIEPLCLPPGYGFLYCQRVVNADMTIGCEFREELIT